MPAAARHLRPGRRYDIVEGTYTDKSGILLPEFTVGSFDRVAVIVEADNGEKMHCRSTDLKLADRQDRQA